MECGSCAGMMRDLRMPAYPMENLNYITSTVTFGIRRKRSQQIFVFQCNEYSASRFQVSRANKYRCIFSATVQKYCINFSFCYLPKLFVAICHQAIFWASTGNLQVFDAHIHSNRHISGRSSWISAAGERRIGRMTWECCPIRLCMSYMCLIYRIEIMHTIQENVARWIYTRLRHRYDLRW